jgi:hypothetical protein
MNPTRLIPWLAARLGLVVLKHNHPTVRFHELPPASGFAYAVLRAFADPRGRRFIQVGANDGSREDPLQMPIRQLGWTGTLIEPRAVFCAQLRRRYANRPDLRIVQAAIAEAQGAQTLYFLDPTTPRLPDFAAGLATLDRQRLETACRDLGLDAGQIREETITTLGWADLEPATHLDATEILVLDTEGHDAVLLSQWPWSRSRPAVVHFEHACLGPDAHHAVLDDLRGRGYQIVIEGGDTTAFLPAT